LASKGQDKIVDRV